MADKKDKDRGESAGGRGLSLITGLDLIMVATARRGAAGASVALATAVASNEVTANGPDMDEKLSRLNARAGTSARPFFVITRSFKALPGRPTRDTRAPCFGAAFLPTSLSLSLFLSPLSFNLSVSPTVQIRSIIKRLIIGLIVLGVSNGTVGTVDFRRPDRNNLIYGEHSSPRRAAAPTTCRSAPKCL